MRTYMFFCLILNIVAVVSAVATNQINWLTYVCAAWIPMCVHGIYFFSGEN